MPNVRMTREQMFELLLEQISKGEMPDPAGWEFNYIEHTKVWKAIKAAPGNRKEWDEYWDKKMCWRKEKFY